MNFHLNIQNFYILFSDFLITRLQVEFFKKIYRRLIGLFCPPSFICCILVFSYFILRLVFVFCYSFVFKLKNFSSSFQIFKDQQFSVAIFPLFRSVSHYSSIKVMYVSCYILRFVVNSGSFMFKVSVNLWLGVSSLSVMISSITE